MLEEILSYAPSEWKRGSYGNSRFKLYNLSPNSKEYNKIAQYFVREDIYTIKRVQHKYAFARYFIKKNQLRATGRISGKEEFRFHGIHEDDLNEALEYNCDPRRYEESEEQVPTFSFYPDDSTTIIVVKHLVGNLPLSESNYYPAYVVSLYDEF